MSYGYTRICEYRNGRPAGSLSISEQQRAIDVFEEQIGNRPLADIAVVYIVSDANQPMAALVERGWIDDNPVDVSINF